jgi:hypothetical protein
LSTTKTFERLLMLCPYEFHERSVYREEVMKEKFGCGGLWSWGGLVLGFLALSGCGTTQNPDAGTIFVDRPEVFTRQRLINRRLAEQRWLENQLDKDADFTLQGYRDVREFTGFALALKGQFDPFSGAQAESLLPDAQRNPQIGQLQDALQVAILNRQTEYGRRFKAFCHLQPDAGRVENHQAISHDRRSSSRLGYVYGLGRHT